MARYEFTLANTLRDQGQGGAISIEDGAALGVLLSHLKSLEALPGRLELFQTLRKNRVSAVQLFSSVPRSEVDRVAEAVKKHIKCPVPSK